MQLEVRVHAQDHLVHAGDVLHLLDLLHLCAAPSDAYVTIRPAARESDGTVRSRVIGELLLGHAPATGGHGAAPRLDRRVTLRAPSGLRIDGSDRVESVARNHL